MDRKRRTIRDRRDVGQVVFLMEKFIATRELGSCCISTEAALEFDTHCKAGDSRSIVRLAGERMFASWCR